MTPDLDGSGDLGRCNASRRRRATLPTRRFVLIGSCFLGRWILLDRRIRTLVPPTRRASPSYYSNRRRADRCVHPASRCHLVGRRVAILGIVARPDRHLGRIDAIYHRTGNHCLARDHLDWTRLDPNRLDPKNRFCCFDLDCFPSVAPIVIGRRREAPGGDCWGSSPIRSTFRFNLQQRPGDAEFMPSNQRVVGPVRGDAYWGNRATARTGSRSPL